MDHGLEALIGFAGSHGNTLELFEFAEEILDQVPPFVNLQVNWDGLCASWVLRYDDFGTSIIEVGDDVIAVERFVSEQSPELDAVNQWRNADAVEAVAWHQVEAHEIAQSIS